MKLTDRQIVLLQNLVRKAIAYNAGRRVERGEGEKMDDYEKELFALLTALKKPTKS